MAMIFDRFHNLGTLFSMEHVYQEAICTKLNLDYLAVVVVCLLQPSSSVSPGCPGPEISVPVSY